MHHQTQATGLMLSPGPADQDQEHEQEVDAAAQSTQSLDKHQCAVCMTSRYQLTNRIVADIFRCVSSDCGHSILFLAVSFLASSFLAEKQHINMKATELQFTKVNHSCLVSMNVS